uniref:Uncharacterized protein n=1 Tax=candidate division WOR-3 bacterium TaxID=2052148 RepID=A0A7C4GE85_UNCW3
MTLAGILEWHTARYPLLGAVDLYKLLHQGAFGPGHAVVDPEAARQSLVVELAGLEPDEEEVVEEPVDPSGVLVRVNLRPFVGNNRAVERLAAAMVQSAAEVRPDPAALAERLAGAVAWLRSRQPGLADQLERVAAEARVQGYPARHHSQLFRLNYRPAYRVVLSRFLPDIRD